MFLLQVDPATSGTIIGNLLELYGPTGLAFGILLTIIMKQNKASQSRIENLEKSQQEQHENHISDQKEMINEYVDLVKNNHQVISDLTGCLRAIKDTLERIERKD